MTTRLVAGLFTDESIYQFIGDVLFDQYDDKNLADLYRLDGQPALSPRAA